MPILANKHKQRACDAHVITLLSYAQVRNMQQALSDTKATNSSQGAELKELRVTSAKDKHQLGQLLGQVCCSCSGCLSHWASPELDTLGQYINKPWNIRKAALL